MADYYLINELNSPVQQIQQNKEDIAVLQEKIGGSGTDRLVPIYFITEFNYDNIPADKATFVGSALYINSIPYTINYDTNTYTSNAVLCTQTQYGIEQVFTFFNSTNTGDFISGQREWTTSNNVWSQPQFNATRSYVNSTINATEVNLQTQIDELAAEVASYPLQNFLGTFNTQADLLLAYPTANYGDFAFVGTQQGQVFSGSIYVWGASLVPPEWVLLNLGTIEVDLTNYVTIDTEQEITAIKTFKGLTKRNRISSDFIRLYNDEISTDSMINIQENLIRVGRFNQDKIDISSEAISINNRTALTNFNMPINTYQLIQQNNVIIRYLKQANIVYLLIRKTSIGSVIINNIIPEGYRPPITFSNVVYTTEGVGNIVIKDDGTLQVPIGIIDNYVYIVYIAGA